MGMSLEDIDLIFRESPSILGTVKYARTKPHHIVDEHGLLKKEETQDREKA